MERESHINSSFADLTQWVISVTIILLLLTPYLCKGWKHTQQLFGKVLVSERGTISSKDPNRQMAQLLIQTPCDQKKLPDEIMEGCEEEIVSSIGLSGSLVEVRTTSELDHSGSQDEKMAIQIVPEHQNADLKLTKLLDGSSKLNVSKPVQEKRAEENHGKIMSVPHEGKAERRFNRIIQGAANRYEVDPALIRAIIMAESSYNPKAVSEKGAKGLMQLMPKTADYLGVEDSFNPEHNINAGVRYFKQLLDQFNGDVKLALAAYNAGSRRVREYKGIPPFKTTQYYVKKVFEYHQRYKNRSQ